MGKVEPDGWKLMQSGPGIRCRSRRSGSGSLQGGGRELERKSGRSRARPAGPPVPFPRALVPVPTPAFGGSREASSRCRTPPPDSPGRPRGVKPSGSGGAAPAGAHLAAALVPRRRCRLGASGGASNLAPRDYSPADSFHS